MLNVIMPIHALNVMIHYTSLFPRQNALGSALKDSQQLKGSALVRRFLFLTDQECPTGCSSCTIDKCLVCNENKVLTNEGKCETSCGNRFFNENGICKGKPKCCLICRLFGEL